MTVICVGVRSSDRVPVVLVRCEQCEKVVWFDLLPSPHWAMLWRCSCGYQNRVERGQPTLAAADRAREGRAA